MEHPIQIIDINRPKPRTVQEIRFGQGKNEKLR
jgi:hypothetical protein